MAEADAEKEQVLYKRGDENDSETWDDSALVKAYDDAISVMKTRLAEENPEFSTAPSNVNLKGKKKKKNKSKKKPSFIPTSWRAGDRCQAVYTEDGEVYEALILTVDLTRAICIVQYFGYGNEEEQYLVDLLPSGSVPSSHKTDTTSETEANLSQVPPVLDEHFHKHKSKKSPSNRHNGVPPPNWNSHGLPFGHMPPPLPFGRMPQSRSQFSQPFAGFQAPSSTPHPFPRIPPPPPLFAQQGSGEENEALYSMLISWYMSGYHTGYYQGLWQASSSSSAPQVPR